MNAEWLVVLTQRKRYAVRHDGGEREGDEVWCVVPGTRERAQALADTFNAEQEEARAARHGKRGAARGRTAESTEGCTRDDTNRLPNNSRAAGSGDSASAIMEEVMRRETEPKPQPEKAAEEPKMPATKSAKRSAKSAKSTKTTKTAKTVERLTLRDEMHAVLGNRAMAPADLAATINKRGRFHKWTKEPVSGKDVLRTADKHSDEFAKKDGLVKVKAAKK